MYDIPVRNLNSRPSMSVLTETATSGGGIVGAGPDTIGVLGACGAFDAVHCERLWRGTGVPYGQPKVGQCTDLIGLYSQRFLGGRDCVNRDTKDLDSENYCMGMRLMFRRTRALSRKQRRLLEITPVDQACSCSSPVSGIEYPQLG